MGFDRTTPAFAAAVLLVAVVYGPLFPAVELPRDPQTDEPVIEGFGVENDLGVSHQLSYRVVGTPADATFDSGVVSAGPTTVRVAAGDDPVTVRYHLRTGNRTTVESVVVPAGEARTTAEPLILAVADRPASVTVRVTATTGGEPREVYTDTLELTGRA